jgi:hypothetical protein
MNKLNGRITKVEEEARYWKEGCRKANMKLQSTTAELQKVKKDKPTQLELTRCSWKWNRTIGSQIIGTICNDEWS